MQHNRPRLWVISLILLSAWVLPDRSAAFAAERTAASKSAETQTVRVLVAYYSRTGNTEQLAKSVAEGAKQVAGAVVAVKRVEDITKEDLQAAQGIILGAPTYFANIPGKMKTIIDDWNWKLKVDFTDKVGGAFATGGGQVGGKEHVVVSLLLFMLNNRMIVAGPLYRNEKTGSAWGEVGAAAMTGPLDPGIGDGERDGARRLGERVARVAKRMVQVTTDKHR